MDIERAFDMCPRWGILDRLHKMGLRGNLPTFIQNFLATRFFKVKVGSSLSDLHIQENGVPQGSVLSPTLFIIMLNDILPDPPADIKITFYADDVTIWIFSHLLRICLDQLQAALNMISNWTKEWV